ncbi:MAG: OmpA family protein [Candidatus Mcinerneyibacterium aminivorans]|uniref:OmpA family protein n=1 Tax=Candidatus Mcinerneyibacterium aminivorans TaxID=2703815 RepID=A0A5D0M9D7_9BACT|nr:MAG: OmpA family protein [Candidatus Mcinerneyibacterium aminivorans]
MKKILIMIVFMSIVFTPLMAKDGELQTSYLYENTRLLQMDGYSFGMGGASVGVLGKSFNLNNHAKDAFLRGFDVSAGMNMLYYNDYFESYTAQSYFGSINFPLKDWFMVNITGINNYLLLPKRDVANQWDSLELTKNYSSTLFFTLARKVNLTPKTQLGLGFTGKYVDQTVLFDYRSDYVVLEDAPGKYTLGKGFGADVSMIARFQLGSSTYFNMGGSLIDVVAPLNVVMGKYFGAGLEINHVLFYKNAKLNLAGDYLINHSDSTRMSFGIEEWILNERLALRLGFVDTKITAMDNKKAFTYDPDGAINSVYNDYDSLNLGYNLYNPKEQITMGLGFKAGGFEANFSYALGSEYTGNSMSFDIAYTGEEVKKSTYKFEPKIELQSNYKYFSPNGDGKRDQVIFFMNPKNIEEIGKWKLEIYNSSADLVKGFKGKKSVPKQITWDGKDKNNKTLPDGEYYALTEIEDIYGNVGSSQKVKFKIMKKSPSVDLTFMPDKLHPGSEKFKFMVTQMESVEIIKTKIVIMKEDEKIDEITYDGFKDSFKWNGIYGDNNYPEKGEELTAYCELTDNAGNTGKSVLVNIPVGEKVVEEDKKEVKMPEIFIAARIRFATSSSKLPSSAKEELDEVVEMLNKKKQLKIRIEGHTDSRGAAQTNYKLSLDRANVVKEYLIDEGVPEDRMVVVGYGEDMPIDSNNTEKGRKNNRRVDVIVISD